MPGESKWALTPENIDWENLAGMAHSELLSLRNSLPDRDPRQPLLAAAEHRAFAREYVRENPIGGIPALAVSIPAYSAAKALGLQKARTPASWNEMIEGYKGLGEGAYAALQDLVYGQATGR